MNITEGPLAQRGTVVNQKTVSGLAEGSFNWKSHVKSIYMSYKIFQGLIWIYESEHMRVCVECVLVSL